MDLSTDFGHQVAQIPFVGVQYLKAGLTDSQVAKLAGPPVLRVGFFARLAGQRVSLVVIWLADHVFVSLETVIMAVSQRS
jgi:hypothetical protein